MSWMPRNSSGHGGPCRSPLACRGCWTRCDTNWHISATFPRLCPLTSPHTGSRIAHPAHLRSSQESFLSSTGLPELQQRRTIADVLLPDGTNVNHALVKEGWCWWYRKYAPGDAMLEGLEKEAQAGRKGLWADPHPVPPWEWRKAGAAAR
jgi:hypothetical protein